MTDLPAEFKTLLQQRIFTERPDGPCVDCGGYHLRACLRVKRKAFHPNGNLTEVEYWASWDDSETVYPEDVWDSAEEDV